MERTSVRSCACDSRMGSYRTLGRVDNRPQIHLCQPTIGPTAGEPTESPPSIPPAKKIPGLSSRDATQCGHSWMGTERLLL
jgi:hypothetical protein